MLPDSIKTLSPQSNIKLTLGLSSITSFCYKQIPLSYKYIYTYIYDKFHSRGLNGF